MKAPAEARQVDYLEGLVVDDNEDNATSLATLLRAHGHAVEVAYLAHEALLALLSTSRRE